MSVTPFLILSALLFSIGAIGVLVRRNAIVVFMCVELMFNASNLALVSFARNLRAIEVLVDQELVRKGRAANEPWKFYDLGHGYCTYDFFDQCPHRMACAKCSFYVPKGSTMAALVEGKNNLLRMRQEIPLSDAELAALDDGVSALESLLSRLADVPTPAGPTPLQLRDSALVQIEGAD